MYIIHIIILDYICICLAPIILVCYTVSMQGGALKIPCHLSSKSRVSCPGGGFHSVIIHINILTENQEKKSCHDRVTLFMKAY